MSSGVQNDNGSKNAPMMEGERRMLINSLKSALANYEAAGGAVGDSPLDDRYYSKVREVLQDVEKSQGEGRDER